MSNTNTYKGILAQRVIVITESFKSSWKIKSKQEYSIKLGILRLEASQKGIQMWRTEAAS